MKVLRRDTGDKEKLTDETFEDLKIFFEEIKKKDVKSIVVSLSYLDEEGIGGVFTSLGSLQGQLALLSFVEHKIHDSREILLREENDEDDLND